MTEKESLTIDYARAIGIILVVMYHQRTNFFDIYHAYMFHMPLFFFLGGVLFKRTTIKNSIKQAVNKYFIYLCLTFYILSLFGIAANKLWGIDFGYQPTFNPFIDIKASILSNVTNNYLFIVGWFLMAYMCCFIVFSIIESMLNFRKITNLVIVSIISFSFGYIGINYISQFYQESKDYLYLLTSQTAVAILFFGSGWIFRDYLFRMLNVYVFIALTSILFILKKYGLATSTVMGWSIYRDGFLVTIFTAFSGIYATLFFSKLLSFSHSNLSFFKEIGRSSRDIMSYHILCFLFIDIAMHYFNGFKLEGNHAYLMRYYDKWTLIVYTLIGVVTPTLFSILYRNKIKPYMMKKIGRLPPILVNQVRHL